MRCLVAKLADVPEGQGTAVEAAGYSVVLFRIGPHVHALRNRCPHAGAPLSIGRLRGRELTCAWHGWAFDVTTGESFPRNPPFDITTYPVTIEAGDIWLELPEHSGPEDQPTATP